VNNSRDASCTITYVDFISRNQFIVLQFNAILHAESLFRKFSE